MKKIIYKTADGNTAVIHPIKSLDEAMKDIPIGVDYLIIDESELPTLDYRNAWDIVDGKVIEDINKVKEIQKDKIRAEREKAFVQLDCEFMKALEESRDYSEITKQKQVLRDLPQEVDACKTIKEINKHQV